MTDKYRNAILSYEKSRSAVVDSTNKICEVEECINPIPSDHPIKDRCIESLYNVRIHNRTVDENKRYFELECGEYQVEPTICDTCKKLDEAIQHRKKCKKEFGAAKRALSTIARFELKKIQDDAP